MISKADVTIYITIKEEYNLRCNNNDYNIKHTNRKKESDHKGEKQMDYLKLLVENIHSTTVATIGKDGHPQTRITACIVEDVRRSVQNRS